MSSCVLDDKILDRLLLRSPQLDKVLIDRDIIKLHARGYCMYPSILPGDILHARYKKPQEINIGEVVIFQRDGVLFAHRVIRKHENGSNLELITQADRSLSEDGAMVPGQNILGVLAAVKRKGRLIDFDRKPLKLPSKFFLNILLLIDLIKSKIKPFFSKSLRRLSEQQIYFYLSRILFPLSKEGLEFSFSVPFQLGEIGEFFRIVSFEDLTVDCSQLSNQEKFCFKITIKKRDSFIASAVFMREPYRNEYGCRICVLYFRMRYAAPLVISILIQKANEVLRGMDNLCFFVHNNNAGIALYKPFFLKSGFVKENDYLELKPVAHEQRKY